MTKEDFQKQILEINSQYIAIQSKAAEISISGSEGLKLVYLETVKANVELLHASLDNLSSMLTEGQKKEMSLAMSQVMKLRKKMLEHCSEEYKSRFLKQKDEQKEAKNSNNVGVGGGQNIF